MIETIQIIIIITATALVIIAAIKAYKQSNRLRNCDTLVKTIYNYKGKTQAKIFSILQLEIDHELGSREIVGFSKPLFKKDGSADYIVYLKKEEV